MKQLNEFEIGWLSGVIDSDGCVVIKKKIRNACIDIYNKNLEILDFAKKICDVDNNLAEGRNKCFCLCIAYKPITLNILIQISPYLIKNRGKALIAIQLLEEKKTYIKRQIKE